MADYNKHIEEKCEKERELLRNIKLRLPELENLLSRVNSHWGYEDLIYRFYHHSNKVYQIQKITQEIIKQQLLAITLNL